MRNAVRKRLFDFTVTVLATPVWLPVLFVCAVLILLLEGRPIFYVSRRQVGPGLVRPVLKFRTMHKNADKIYNRDTVPVEGVCFLNVPRDSAVYTRIGSLIERLAFTELPQLLHVLTGKMSLIGSRPLPERVMAMLREIDPAANDRFLTKGGLTGPIQLIGRDRLGDADRLALEIEYCRIASTESYSVWLDFWLLLETVAAVIDPRRLMTVVEVRTRMHRFARPAQARNRVSDDTMRDTSRGGAETAHAAMPSAASALRRITTQK